MDEYADLLDGIEKFINQKKIRPLGNKMRLGFGGGECLDYRAQFQDRESVLRYYAAFLNYSRNNPPPMLLEIIAAYTPNTLYSEKYSFILPYFRSDVHEDYNQWAREAIMSCNEVQRQHSYSSGNKYSYVPMSISSQGAVIKWTIIPPGEFNFDSEASRELLSDPPEMGFDVVKIEGEGIVIPEKPNPSGPWIGVLFEINNFDEALYGRAATKQLLDIVGEDQLSGSVIHGGDLLPEARYWCNAIHTASQEQADRIEKSVRISTNEKLAQDGLPILHGQDIPVNSLPFQGFVSADGVYVGK